MPRGFWFQRVDRDRCRTGAARMCHGFEHGAHHVRAVRLTIVDARNPTELGIHRDHLFREKGGISRSRYRRCTAVMRPPRCNQPVIACVLRSDASVVLGSMVSEFRFRSYPKRLNWKRPRATEVSDSRLCWRAMSQSTLLERSGSVGLVTVMTVRSRRSGVFPITSRCRWGSAGSCFHRASRPNGWSLRAGRRFEPEGIPAFLTIPSILIGLADYRTPQIGSGKRYAFSELLAFEVSRNGGGHQISSEQWHGLILCHPRLIHG